MNILDLWLLLFAVTAGVVADGHGVLRQVESHSLPGRSALKKRAKEGLSMTWWSGWHPELSVADLSWSKYDVVAFAFA